MTHNNERDLEEGERIKKDWIESTHKVYADCVKNVSNYIGVPKGFSTFDGSTMLAITFKLPKETTMNDLMEFRRIATHDEWEVSKYGKD